MMVVESNSTFTAPLRTPSSGAFKDDGDFVFAQTAYKFDVF